MIQQPENLPPRWPHRLACLLAAIVFPLIWVGGLVTTTDAGMAVPDWPGTYGYNMFLYPIETWLYGPFDLFIEHGHRLLGALAGLIAIALVVVTYRTEPRTWVKRFSVILLALVIFQGLLGGLRVELFARWIARIHGCVGPAFFAAVVAFCVATSRWWYRQMETRQNTRLRSGWIWLPIIMLGISYGQLVIGAFLRHIDEAAPPDAYKWLIVAHISVAILIAFGTFMQWVITRQSLFRGAGVRASANVLMLLVLSQISLGFGTWVVKFGWPGWFRQFNFAAHFIVPEKSLLQMNLITAHVVVGSLILAFWTVHAFRCNRRFSAAPKAGNISVGSSHNQADVQPIAAINS
jgi:cytochrome c oxidase assembly protein subunit 15